MELLKVYFFFEPMLLFALEPSKGDREGGVGGHLTPYQGVSD